MRADSHFPDPPNPNLTMIKTSQTYELLTGRILFQPQRAANLTADEGMLLLQYALTGETLCKDVIEQSHVKEKYFDREGGFHIPLSLIPVQFSLIYILKTSS